MFVTRAQRVLETFRLEASRAAKISQDIFVRENEVSQISIENKGEACWEELICTWIAANIITLLTMKRNRNTNQMIQFITQYQRIKMTIINIFQCILHFCWNEIPKPLVTRVVQNVFMYCYGKDTLPLQTFGLKWNNFHIKTRMGN